MKLEYNYLNLNGIARDMSSSLLATYSWLADGTKIGVVDDSGAGFEYLGSLIYRRNGDGLTLESAAFGSGRIMVSEGSNGNVYTPNYFITDHLGSTRAIVNAQRAVIEQNDYYPFGGKHENPQLIVSNNRFRFSGKEDQTTGDLPYQDFGARFFGKKLPIWTGADPLAKDYPWISPYAYCYDNPILFWDPTGEKGLPYINKIQYKGNGWDYARAVENGLRGLVNNTVIATVNSGIQTYETIRDDGLSGYGRALGQEATGIANLIAEGAKAEWGYISTTPIGEQFNNAVSPQTVENYVEIGVPFAIGGSAIVAGKTASTISTATNTATKGTQTIYRVYGGQAEATGRYWTPVNPKNVSNYRNAAGLPETNTGRFVIEATTSKSNISKTLGGATAIGNNKGGLPEYKLYNPEDIKIKRVSGVNPEF